MKGIFPTLLDREQLLEKIKLFHDCTSVSWESLIYRLRVETLLYLNHYSSSCPYLFAYSSVCSFLFFLFLVLNSLSQFLLSILISSPTSSYILPLSLLLKFYSILLFPLLSSFILTPSWGILDLYLDLTTYFINQVVSLLWVIECAIYNFAKATGINQYYLGKLGCRIPLSVTRPQFRQVKVVSEGHLKKWF